MTAINTIAAIVESAVAESPLPATFTEIDPLSQRRFKRFAEAQGTTPEALYAAMLAGVESAAADDALAAQIARAVRR